MKKIERGAGANPEEQLRTDIDAWIARHGLSATRFGREALGDPGFVGALTRGRRVRLDTADRALAFMGEAPLGPAFRSEVESFLTVSGTKPHVLGEEALGDPSFISRLRRGSSTYLGTIDRVRAWMAAQADMTIPPAGNTPGSFTTKAPHEGCGVRNKRKGETRMNRNGRHYLSTREAAEPFWVEYRTEEGLKTHHMRMVRVEDDSMEPGLREGDRVVVDLESGRPEAGRKVPDQRLGDSRGADKPRRCPAMRRRTNA